MSPEHLGCHLALLASERFFASQSRWPGSEDNVAMDISYLEDIVRKLLQEGPKLSDLPLEMSKGIAEV